MILDLKKLKPLTTEQISQIIDRFDMNSNLDPPSTNSKLDFITPRQIFSLLAANADNSIVKEFFSKCTNFLYQYGNGVDFNSGIILPKKDIIVPSKEITTSITVVNDTLLEKAKQNPQIMYTFSPREFEMMVCELLDKQGYNVKLTKQTRDGGKDIIVVQNSLLGEFCIYVECKKYDAQNPISVQLVRELYGTVAAEDATAGMLITTSYFTKDAQEFSQKIKHRMALRDYNDLVRELNNIKC